MQISRLHACLFTKEGCPPCIKTKEFAYDVIENNLDLAETLSFMRKEAHSALVEAYQLNLYPTLLIVGPNGLEIERIVGGKAVREVLEDKLIEIYRDNNA
jgi:glutaredoxin